MNNFLIITIRYIILLFMFMSWEKLVASEICQNLSVHIKRIGLEADPAKTIKEFHLCAQKALPLLIKQLHVIDPEVLNEEWKHQIWVERALRSITGQYFQFVSSQKLYGRLANFRQQSDSLGLVMEWMSRGEILMAPQDVQLNVIKAWKAWSAKNENSFTVKQFQPYGEWFW